MSITERTQSVGDDITFDTSTEFLVQSA